MTIYFSPLRFFTSNTTTCPAGVPCAGRMRKRTYIFLPLYFSTSKTSFPLYTFYSRIYNHSVYANFKEKFNYEA